MFAWISWILGSIFGARSEQLVDKLDIPADSKRFVAALRVPDDPSCIVYLLTAQVLSERSVRDVKQLVAAARPHAVLAAVQSHRMLEFLEEERIASDLDHGVVVPDSFLDAFTDFSTRGYSSESLAVFDFQRIIFGTTYHGYVLAAKHAALQSGSNFGVLQVFLADAPEAQHQSPDNWSLAFSRHLPSTSRPEFAASFFPIFLMLDQLNDSIWPRTHGSNAVAAAERIIADTAAGKEVSRELLDSVLGFRVTLEYFRLLQHDISRRIAMNAPPPFASSYTGLPDQEKCEVLLTQALQRQAKRSKVVVAVLDGSQVLGVRKYWNVLVPPEAAAMSDSFLFSAGDDTTSTELDEAGGNLVALGAGAAVVAGATKFLSSKAPVLAKLPWAPFSPARSSIVRAFVGLAKRKSIGAVHWSFYGLMRQRTGMSSLRRPWVVFGGSVLTAVGLFYADDQIGGAVEAVPSAISVARLGRGLKNLKRTAAEANSETVDDLYGPAYRAPRLFD
ncbi:uncharacterized protein LOC9654545 [Selaginella moellendorffii]|nr:uncharacterized protein LOC9654545 [Selaginella moellendorffii]XP_024524484.1 uncharacterized protein LOC9654545 [Selaginella moellendorffii]|eukprot:XP_002964063.2 uncharacterized protein LOC9654545 [Selaginella moellendorffii]